MKKTIDLWTYYDFSKPVREAVEYFADGLGARNGHLLKIDLFDFEGCESDESDWGRNARILKRFFCCRRRRP